jgi:glycosyltransferase involved in cell wall biosynthesis
MVAESQVKAPVMDTYDRHNASLPQNSNRFVLMTAAKNEERYIDRAIASIVRQTALPVAWFIVDDCSTDRTAQLVRERQASYPFIHLISRAGDAKRSFGAQYRAINHAYTQGRDLDFSFVGVIDADIEIESKRYFESLLGRFNEEPLLGVAGGYIYERSHGAWLARAANSTDSVAGGIQMFRRDCFDKIGGYSPLLFGGEDWLAQIDAKRAGWRVMAIPELVARHYRPTSSADGRIRGLFRLGMMDGSFGSDPLFEALKCARRVGERPAVIGSFVRFAGYWWWRASRRSTLLPEDKCRYLRQEQSAKLRALLALTVTPTKKVDGS